MTISVYTDGSGGSNSGFGFFVKESGKSSYKKVDGLTNNQAEYLAIILALKEFEDTDDDVIIYSDSKNTICQLNHEFAINNDALREFARQAWEIIARYSSLKLQWVPRRQNLAGKMLGS